MLYSNGFSKCFTDTYIGNQLRKLLLPYSPQASVRKAIVYFPINYLGKRSFNLRNKITKLMNEFYPQVNVRVIFKPKLTMHNLFKFKDRIPEKLQSSVVYKYTCSCCNATYIGKSKRQYQVRIFEHFGKSIRTNRQFSNPPFSAIRQHSDEKDHPINIDSFSILCSRSTDMELSIVESIYCIKEKPSLCNYERSVDLLCFW